MQMDIFVFLERGHCLVISTFVISFIVCLPNLGRFWVHLPRTCIKIFRYNEKRHILSKWLRYQRKDAWWNINLEALRLLAMTHYNNSYNSSLKCTKWKMWHGNSSGMATCFLLLHWFLYAFKSMLAEDS